MENIIDVKIAVIGNVDSGKSSLIGTLLSGKNDDGRGCNRELVMNYPHELETGQTSSVGYQLLGFRADGTAINIDSKNKRETWPRIINQASKIITFMDLAGHEKYLKTTIHGISANHPDYAIILIEAKGIRGMTKEHVMLAVSFGIPFIIIITKIDLYPPPLVIQTCDNITTMIKSIKKDPWFIREEIDLEIPLVHYSYSKNHSIPVFLVSNVTGENLDLVSSFLFRLPRRIDFANCINDPFEMAVIEGFTVHGIGTVAHGFLVRGTVRVGDQVWVGPDSTGVFHKSKIKTCQFKRISVEFVLPGHHCTVGLPGIDLKMLRQGVYILHDEIPTRVATFEFIANIKVLSSHPITIKNGYCPVLNLDNIRMAAKIVKIRPGLTESDEYNPALFEGTNNQDSIQVLRGGCKALVQFRFMYRPAYMRKDTIFVFREGRTRGFGKVISLL